MDKKVSLEASSGKRNRKGAETYILNMLNKILPNGKSVQIYKDMFKKMSDKEFEQFMLDLKEKSKELVIICPNFGNKTIDTTRNLKIAKEDFNYDFFQRLYIGAQGDVPGYLTPIKYMVIDLPMRRHSQSLVKKISIPDTNSRVNFLTGQLADGHDTKSARLTFPEVQLLAALGLDASLVELMKYRGGDIGGNNAMNAMIAKYGKANLATLSQYATGVESTKTFSSYLKAMHLKNNAANLREKVE